MRKVDHERQSAGAEQVTILYNVQLGLRRRVEQGLDHGKPLF